MASRTSNVSKFFDFNINGYEVITREVRMDYKTWSLVYSDLKIYR